MITVPTITRNPDYSDLDLDFFAHPGTGDVSKKIGEDAIKRSLRNLVYTNFYDRPFRSYIGSNVQKILFDNITPLTATFVKNAVQEVIVNFEPRVALLNVNVSISPDLNAYDVTIKFMIQNKLEPTILSLFLERIR